MNRTSVVEITNISKHGFWLLIEDKERFVAFKEFPWFQSAAIGQLLNVELASPRRLYWPDLDVDLAVESVDSPNAFRSKASSGLRDQLDSSRSTQNERAPEALNRQLEKTIKAHRAQLLQVHGVLTCLYEVLLHADGEQAVHYALATYVAASLINKSAEELDSVRIWPLIEALASSSDRVEKPRDMYVN